MLMRGCHCGRRCARTCVH